MNILFAAQFINWFCISQKDYETHTREQVITHFRECGPFVTTLIQGHWGRGTSRAEQLLAIHTASKLFPESSTGTPESTFSILSDT